MAQITPDIERLNASRYGIFFRSNIESIELSNHGISDPLTQDRGLEGQRSKVALHLLNLVLAEKLQIFNRGIFAVIDRWDKDWKLSDTSEGLLF